MFSERTKKDFSYLCLCCLLGFVMVQQPVICFAQQKRKESSSQFKAKLAKVPRVDCYTALALFKAGELTLIDAHNDNNSQNSIIVGALDIPLQKIGTTDLKLPKDRIIGCF